MATKKQKNYQEQDQSLSSEIVNLREEILKKFGEGTVTVHKQPRKIETVSTGILALDRALGGGVAMGRFIELLGNASSGKTTILLSTMAAAQRKYPDKIVVYIDAEHALDLDWAVKIGIDLTRFDHVEPNLAEEALEITEKYANSGLASIIAIDSIPALIPLAEAEGDIGDSNIGIQARLMAVAMRRIGRLIYKRRQTSVMVVNQKRAQLQSRGGFQGFEQTKATGGMAVPFYMTSRLEVYRIGTLKQDDKEIGQEVQVYVKKNKVLGGPGARITFEINNNTGIDTAKELLNLGINGGKIKKGGAWYTLDGVEGKFQGENAVKEILNKDLERWKKLLDT
jgi:recombination protein RecA